MEERFTTRFASSEKEFLTQFGVNFGFTQIHSKVDRCYFLSSDAKALYHNLNQYAYNGSKECFPSQALLRAELGWSKHLMTKCVDELRQKGFVSTHRNPGSSLVYTLEELHTIPAIVHSEIVHELRKEFFSSTDREQFATALADYKESELFVKVVGSPDPTVYQESIREWFMRWQSGEVQEAQDEVGIAELESSEFEEPLTESAKTTVPNRSRRVTVIREEGVEKVGDPTKPEKSRKKKVPKDPAYAPVEDWDSTHFRKHFKELYFKKYNNLYQWTKEDQGHIGRLMSVKDNHLLKEQMEKFFEIDQFSPKTVRLFSSTNTQSVLDEFSRTGKLPWYMTKKDERPQLEGIGDDYDAFS